MKLSKSRLKIYLSVGSLIILVLLILYNFWQRVPLPSDEKLIDFFYKNRSQIEELIQSYRAYDAVESKGDYSYWFSKDNNEDLLKKVGIRIGENTLGLAWLPEPYSIETAKKIKEIGYGEQAHKLNHLYGPLSIHLLDRRYLGGSIRYGVLMKYLVIFPESPRIENGFLLGPFDEKGKYSFKIPVRASLNYYPTEWRKTRHCILRKIESRWFISLCRSR